MEHLALPKEMDGCRYLGPVRSSKPSYGDAGSEWIYESLKKKAARKRGDTIAVLPGGRAVAGTMRASVFRCEPAAQGTAWLGAISSRKKTAS